MAIPYRESRSESDKLTAAPAVMPPQISVGSTSRCLHGGIRPLAGTKLRGQACIAVAQERSVLGEWAVLPFTRTEGKYR